MHPRTFFAIKFTKPYLHTYVPQQELQQVRITCVGQYVRTYIYCYVNNVNGGRPGNSLILKIENDGFAAVVPYL